MRRAVVSVLSLSAAGLVGILGWEGYSDTAYKPLPHDEWTIGFGTTGEVQPGDTTTPHQAVARALDDVTRFEGALRECVNVPLAQHEYDAFVSLAYNIGPTAFCGSTLVDKLNAGDYEAACQEIRRWVYSGGRKVAGLINRREAEYRRCIGEAGG